MCREIRREAEKRLESGVKCMFVAEEWTTEREADRRRKRERGSNREET